MLLTSCVAISYKDCSAPNSERCLRGVKSMFFFGREPNQVGDKLLLAHLPQIKKKHPIRYHHIYVRSRTHSSINTKTSTFSESHLTKAEQIENYLRPVKSKGEEIIETPNCFCSASMTICTCYSTT